MIDGTPIQVGQPHQCHRTGKPRIQEEVRRMIPILGFTQLDGPSTGESIPDVKIFTVWR